MRFNLGRASSALTVLGRFLVLPSPIIMVPLLLPTGAVCAPCLASSLVRGSFGVFPFGVWGSELRGLGVLRWGYGLL